MSQASLVVCDWPQMCIRVSMFDFLWGEEDIRKSCNRDNEQLSGNSAFYQASLRQSLLTGPQVPLSSSLLCSRCLTRCPSFLKMSVDIRIVSQPAIALENVPRPLSASPSWVSEHTRKMIREAGHIIPVFLITHPSTLNRGP